MSRGINQVECIGLTIGVMVLHLDCVALNSNAFFAFEVHIVENLSLHFTLIKRVSIFKQAVGKCTFAVIDVSDDTEIADIFHIYSIFILRANIQKNLYL